MTGAYMSSMIHVGLLKFDMHEYSIFAQSE